MAIEKLDFKKVTKENLPYTLILTKVIQNIKHKDALAVWVYLCSLPPDWNINKEHLKNHFHLGDRTLQSIFSYLNRSNLILYKRERFEDGTLGVVVVHVLCGDEFKLEEPYVLPTPQKTRVVDLTTPQKTTRVANHTSGSEALQKKHNNKANKKAQKKERATTTSLSDDFRPSEELKHKIMGLPGLNDNDLNLEHKKFYVHYKSTGAKRLDWEATYAKWMLDASQYKLNRRG